MSLSNEQLLYLSALTYYNIDTLDVSNKNVKSIINDIKKVEKTTCFDGIEWIKLYHLQKMIVN